jgi:tetratricopeptide (TPR) repeat protein
MSPRPAIFISAASSELRSARQLVANALTFLGYEPEWQEIFSTEQGDLRALLRRRIDSCKGLVQLVGQCYGAEPLSIDQELGRVSYTQYEALYATKRGKKVWYLILDESFPTDAHQEEDEEKRKLQSDYRAKVKADCQLYHPLGSKEGLEASVLRLRDELTRLRRGVKRWAAVVAGLLVLSVALTVWLLQNQRHSSEQLQVVQEKLEKLQEGVNLFAEVQNRVRQEQPGQKPDQLEQGTYVELGKELGLDPAVLKEQLPHIAQELKRSPNVTTYDRANAAFVAGDYNEAERLALAAADEAQSASPPKNAAAIKAFELAGWAAEKRIEYADALRHLQEAAKLTDRGLNPTEWANVQFAISGILYDQGRYADDDRILREVLKERERAFGPDHPDTLAARNNLALALDHEGKYAEAEAESRAVILLQEKVLGPENVDTLATHETLAIALADQGKHREAESEFRTLIRLREKVLGAQNLATLKARNDLAIVLSREGRYADAATEERGVLSADEKVLGPEHPETLTTRQNLAVFLHYQGNYAEAEAEYSAVLKSREKLLGPEHPDTLGTRHWLAIVFADQGKHAEAEAEFRTVLRVAEKVLGPESPSALQARSDLAEELDLEGKYVEAETEDRLVLKLKEKVFGPEHPHTLASRSNLAEVLDHEGKYAESETEGRAALTQEEKALGPEHPDTLATCFILATCLRSEGKLEEASSFAQRAAGGARKILGPDHPATKKYEQLTQELLSKNS